MENLIQDNILEFLTKIGSKLISLKIDKKNNEYKVNIATNDSSLLIGHKGENIFALQHLLKIMIFQNNEEQADFYLDIDHYRRRQEENILALAERKVESARKSNTSQNLPPMSPYYRRLIHLHLKQNKFKDITTESKGEREKRYITIIPHNTENIQGRVSLNSVEEITQ